MFKWDEAPNVYITKTKLQVMLDSVSGINNNKIYGVALHEVQVEINWVSTPDAPIGVSINDLLDDYFATIR